MCYNTTQSIKIGLVIMKLFFIKHKKKIIWTVIILAVAGYFIMRRNKVDLSTIQTDTVKIQNLKQTVLATGEVNSEIDLSLSFKASGVVSKVVVKVGSKVKQGDVLASLEARDVAARLTQARGALAQANANYQKVLDGASGEDVAVSQVAVDNAKISLENTKKQQQVLVDNAYKSLINSTLEAVPDSGNSNNTTLAITGTYIGKDPGTYRIIQEGKTFYVTGLENTGNQSINTTVASPLPVGTKGLYVTFPITISSASDRWTVTIPNTKAVNYITNYNAYQSALETQKISIASAENAVASAQAALDLKRAKARPADLEAVQAQILSAQGQVEAAQADLENTIIRAPSEGTITKVDVKVGELATALKQALILQDINNLHVEANISEANIANIKLGQKVDATFDALGLDRKFTAEVELIDPASTVVSGVVNYKVTVQVDKLVEIKPGMTANLTILTGEKPGVLVAPLRSVIAKDGKKFVRVVTDTKTKTYKEVEVQTGMEGDGGLVEVTSGLNEGQEIVTFIKTK